MRIPLFGTGVSSGQKQVTVRKTVGMYWERRGETEKAPMVAVPFPGSATHKDTGINGALRAIAATDGNSGIVYFLIGTKAYQYIQGGSVTEIGTIADPGVGYLNQGIVTGAAGTLFVAAGKLYLYDGGTFSDKTPVGWSIGSVAWVGGYYVATESGGSRFCLSTDGTNWGDIATAEAAQDPLSVALEREGELVLIGRTSTEFWAHTGDSDFPFARTAVASVGTVYNRAACMVGGVPYMMTGNAFPPGAQAAATPPCIVRINGYAPEVVSTPDIERIIQSWLPAYTIAYGFTLGGRPMFAISDRFSSSPGLIFDSATGLWFEVSSAFMSQFRVAFDHTYFGLVGAGTGSPVVLRALDSSQHNHDTRRIITDHVVSPDGERFTVDSLRLDMATNMDAAEKSASLKVSRDGGLSWGGTQSVGLGTTTGPQKKVEFRRLGRSRSFTFDLSFPTDVPLTVHSASLNASD